MPETSTQTLERATLPPPTTNVDQAERDLAEHGICILAGLLDAETLGRARTALYRAAESDPARGRTPHFALDYGDSNQRIWNLPSRDPVFVELAEHPVAIRLLRSQLGWPMLLSSFSANIAGPGGDDSALHADMQTMPQPWNSVESVNCAWAIDAFTDENGATRFVPGSQRLGRAPTAEEQAIETVPGEVPEGSLIVFEGRLWHKTGINRTADQRRAGLFANYTKRIYRPQENWFLSLDPSIVQFASETMLTLLGYHTFGLGMVNGMSPLWRNADPSALTDLRASGIMGKPPSAMG